MSRAVWHPSKEWIESTRLYQWMKKLGFSNYDEFYKQSVSDIEWFWDQAVREMGVEWFQSYTKTLDLSQGKMWPKWFIGGKINVTYNALYKWLNRPESANRKALIWEGEEGKVRTFSYKELGIWVDRVAYGLKQQGVQKGDRVALFLPMIPETVVSILAISKIGAIYVPTFSGFGADALNKRIQASGAKLLITADGFFRRGKIVGMKEIADEAVATAPSIEKVVVVRRTGREIPWNERDLEWSELEKGDGNVPVEIMNSDDPFMLIYTSGTTGKPKGTVHIHSGFPLKAAFDGAFGMDIKEGDNLFWVTDMGWMMGPFQVYASLLNGASIMMYDGTPDYPAPNRLWKLVQDHRVTHLGISPTLIRSMIGQGTDLAAGINLSSLRVIGSTGEPWNPEPWMWLFEEIGKRRIPIFNYSGGTEISGGILGNILLKPISPATFNGPLPGMDADVWDHEGNSVRGEVGELVIKQPWVGMTNGFWEEPERYVETYWSRWTDTWVHGDWVMIDQEGDWTITGRSDDTLNIAGKRVGPAELESVLVEHEHVVEAATIGVPDEVKGEVAVCFLVLRKGIEPNEQLNRELMHLVEKKLGKALRPKQIHFIAELPKTRNGKIMRRVIRSSYLCMDQGDLSSLENPNVLEQIRKLGNII